DKNKDIRYAAYFDERTVTTPVVGKMTLLIKYPGNPKLYTKVTNYCNMPKVFRASEMYLIAAEAEYLSPNGSIAKANSYLNDLRKARIKGWSEKTYAGEALMSEIRNERVKELFCEGFRLSDLKRWHLGFTRSEGQDPSLIMQGENYATCTRPADDPQFLWPIPTSELEANPNMKDQQNPGYKMD
ncbi:MAG TPA: RagB/SusD family nutrient uptake outer membrane protein, partial [Rikenellaceae bacterium]|nr:RagB/SusD family nutrient uptake outer membrane protein [Rikenellaceae bacterium]